MTEDRKALLQRLWGNPDITVTSIAQELGFKQRSSVNHAARRLGLPPREPNRNIYHAHEANRQRFAERRQARQAVKDNPEPPGPPPQQDRPICFVCHAPCSTWDGHNSCRGRKAA